MTTDEKRAGPAADRYKWVALTNTTLGVLMVTINSSIVLISLPAIFRGIGLDPLQPANVSYLLWILQGFLVVTAVLVVSFGRLGDTFGRVRIYNPIQTMLGPALKSLPAATARTVSSTPFFPHVISGPFHDALRLTFGVAAAMMLLVTGACFLTRPRPTGASVPAPARPGQAAARADATDALAAEAARLEAQVRHWRQLVMAGGAAVPRVVTVSAPLGAGGDQVAQRLARQLDLHVADRAIPAAVARELAVPVASAEARDEQREPGALRLLAGAANTEPLFGPEVADADFDDEATATRLPTTGSSRRRKPAR